MQKVIRKLHHREWWFTGLDDITTSRSHDNTQKNIQTRIKNDDGMALGGEAAGYGGVGSLWVLRGSDVPLLLAILEVVCEHDVHSAVTSALTKL